MSRTLTFNEEIALGMLSEGSHLLAVAARAADATNAPVIGGVAVFLHGYRRTTEDVDLFADDPQTAADALRAAGATWDAQRREHTLDGVPIHLVTAAQTGSRPDATERRHGVTIISLPDLVRFKLHAGLDHLDRARDLADVVELIRRVPLDKSFAARLPTAMRDPFKRLVDAVRSAPPHP
ncbi:MAG: hypothetical protein KJZ54_10030 [Phycisphaerales bacterium]|nr:hypothetical protein [Phycisphaerales bacterium]